MKACTFQTVAKLYLCPVSEEAILHVLSDEKMTYSTLTELATCMVKKSGRNTRRHNERWKILCPQITFHCG